jgi:WD40 repeat protein
MPPEVIPREFFDRVMASGNELERRMLDAAYHLDQSGDADVWRLRSGKALSGFADDKALARFWNAHDSGGSLKADQSITEREIRYAALDPNTRMEHCFFYMRRLETPPGIVIPDSLRCAFIEENPPEQVKLKRLQEQVGSIVSGPVVRDYHAAVTGIRLDPAFMPADPTLQGLAASGADGLDPVFAHLQSPAFNKALEQYGTAELSGMEKLGNLVVDDLWAAIQRFIAQQSSLGQVVAGDRENAYQERFVRQRERVFIGREVILESLLEYLAEDGRSSLLVTGASGSGKSALLANFAAKCRTLYPDAKVASYFIGASPGSSNLHTVLSALCRHLLESESDVSDLPTDPLRAKRAFQAVMREAASEYRVIVILDGLDQLEDSLSAAAGLWFPFVLPVGVKLVSSGAPSQLVEALKRRFEPDKVLQLDDLTRGERTELVRQHLALRQKRLPTDLISRLVDETARADSRLPLYLLVALEELFLFGSHAALGARIDKFPTSVSALLDQVLDRLEQDHGHQFVRCVCSWLAVSQAGITEPEMLDLLTRNHPNFRAIDWSWLRQAMQIYLQPADEGDGKSREGGALGFFVDQFRTVVFRRYLGMRSATAEPTAAYRASHRVLAAFFRTVGCPDGDHWQSDRARALAALPYHLLRGDLPGQAARTLLDGTFLQAKVDAGLLLPLIQDITDAAATVTGYDGQSLAALERALRSDIHFIDRHPESLFQSVWNQSFRGGVDADQLVAASLAGLLDAWMKRKQRNKPAFPWIRALLPSRADGVPADRITLRGHQHVVFSVAFSPDGSRIASGSRDATARVWDVETGSEVATLIGHCNQVQDVAFLDNDRLLSASGNPEIKASDGKVIGETDYTVRLWSIPDEIELACSVQHDDMIHTIAVSPDKSQIISGDTSGIIRSWPTSNWSEIRRIPAHTSSVRALVHGPHNILSCANDGDVVIWLPGDLVPQGTFSSLGGNVWDMDLSPGGDRLAIAQDHVSVFDLKRGAEVLRIEAPVVYGIGWTTDGKQLVGGVGDGSIRVWDAKDGSELSRLTGHEGPVTCIAICPRGRKFASGSMDGTVRLWTLDGRSADTKPLGHEQQVLCLSPSRCNAAFVSGSEDGTAIVWDASEGSIRSRLTGHTDSVTCALLINDDSEVVTGSYDQTLRFWNASTGHLLASIPGRSMGPHSITLSPDGGSLAYCALDHTVRVLDVRTRSPKAVLLYVPGPTQQDRGVPESRWRKAADKAKAVARRFIERNRASEAAIQSAVVKGEHTEPHWIVLAFSSDGTTLAAGGLADIAVWDVKNGTLRTSFDPPSGLFCLTLSPDGTKLACGGLGAVELWDVKCERAHAQLGWAHPSCQFSSVFPRCAASRLIGRGRDGARVERADGCLHWCNRRGI